ncbi:MAG: hypothetical protein Q9190_002750 [Brigantiaea leucoxantha]
MIRHKNQVSSSISSPQLVENVSLPADSDTGKPGAVPTMQTSDDFQYFQSHPTSGQREQLDPFDTDTEGLDDSTVLSDYKVNHDIQALSGSRQSAQNNQQLRYREQQHEEIRSLDLDDADDPNADTDSEVQGSDYQTSPGLELSTKRPYTSPVEPRYLHAPTLQAIDTSHPKGLALLNSRARGSKTALHPKNIPPGDNTKNRRSANASNPVNNMSIKHSPKNRSHLEEAAFQGSSNMQRYRTANDFVYNGDDLDGNEPWNAAPPAHNLRSETEDFDKTNQTLHQEPADIHLRRLPESFLRTSQYVDDDDSQRDLVTSARPERLVSDYSTHELSKMTYEQLREEPFDNAPRAQQNYLLPLSDSISLEEKLQALFQLKGKEDELRRQQQEFFSSLPIDQYEECGDLLVQKFASLISKYTSARQRRRKLVRELEEEIGVRDTFVSDRRNRLQADLNRLKKGGEDVISGKAVRSD